MRLILPNHFIAYANTAKPVFPENLWGKIIMERQLKTIALFLFIAVLSLAVGAVTRPLSLDAAPLAAIGAPTLKWQHGGCYASWCETGWYSSPAVADVDGDGQTEVIGAAYSLFILNGATGALERQVDPPGDRVWPGVVVADIDADGALEIVTAHGSGYLNVYDQAGANLVWSRRPTTSELRGLSAYDLDNDGTLELIVTAGIGSKTNTWVYEHDGTLRSGWPQLNNNNGYAWGVYNANAAVGDLDRDGAGEIVVPSDVHYICAYEANGSHIPASAVYGSKNWGQVGIWESLATELRGWGECNGVRAESYRTNFADGPAVMADVNHDGANEVVATGNVYDCYTGYPPSRYVGVYIFNADRSRFNTGGYDWRTTPVDTGAPISEDYSVIESATYNPVTADLDGDGNLEILFSSYDGGVHAYWLNQTTTWTYKVYPGSGYLSFATEPVVADLDNDGHAEVIFASWMQKGSNQTGKLYILDYQGHLVQQADLPAAFGLPTPPNWNGALAAPTLANIDGDADLEVVLNTAHSGLVVYDLPGTANARILWGTGRWNYQRTGSWLGATLNKQVNAGTADAGQTLTYTLTLLGAGTPLTLTDAIPAGVAYVSGSALRDPPLGNLADTSSGITWTGTLSAGQALTVTLAVTVTTADPQAIVNRARLNDGQQLITRTVTTIANGLEVYLPVILKP